MGGSYTPAPPESPSTSMAAYSKYLPTVQNETNAGVAPAEQALVGATQQAIPQLNALDLAQLQQFALPQAVIGQQVANSNAQAGAATNLQQIQGAGGQAATAAAKLQGDLNPAWSAAQKGAAEGVNAINLTGLSPGEEAATERSTNQNNVGTGNLGVLNPTNTVSNAMNFGGAFNSKIGLLNNATNTASNAANSGGFSPVATALGQPQPSTASNFGTAQFNSGSPTTANSAASSNVATAGGLLNNLTSMNNTITQADTQNSIASSPAAYLGTVCCFIFLEAYYGKIPWHVRHYRDKIYSVNHDIATGYRRTAKWLVPMMQKYSFVRMLVWSIMIKPITKNCVFRRRMNPRTITHLWLKLWAMLGKGHDEIEYAMSWSYPKV